MIVMVFPFSILTVSAATTMDSSSVYSDLKEMEIDLSPYKKNEEDTQAKVLSFIEFCYDANGNQNDYGLYLYVYNPSCEPINISSQFNTVQLGTKDANGNIITPQKKYRLVCTSFSTSEDGSDKEYLYYKFKIDGAKEFVSKLSKVKRIYDIVDLELMYGTEINPRKTKISNAYSCRGYMPYHGETGKNTDSTYYCFAETLESIEIELGQTTWKTASSDKGSIYQYEVFSVYFAIPDYYLDKYGNMDDEDYKGLSSVRGEYYEYKINGFVSSNSAVVSSLESQIGVTPSKFVNQVGNKFLPFSDVFYTDSSFPYSFYCRGLPYNSTSLKYNLKWYNNNVESEFRTIPSLFNVFYDTADDFVLVSTEELMESVFQSGGDKFYAYNHTEDGKKAGWRDYEINVEKDKDLNTKIASFASTNMSFISWLSGSGRLDEDKGGYAPIKPIKMLSSDDLSAIYLDSVVAENLFMAEGDVDTLRDYVEEAENDEKTTYLMRFAVRDYLFSDVELCDANGNEPNGSHFYFEKTIFHNFDVIEFTFKNSKGEYTKVPVSCRPISIVGNVTVIDPDDADVPSGIGKVVDTALNLATWVKILILLGGLIVILLIITFFGKSLGILFRGIGAIVAAPFKLVGKGVSYATQRSDRRFDRKMREAENVRKDENERRKDNDEVRKDNAERRKDRDEIRKDNSDNRASDENRRREERHQSFKKAEKYRIKQVKEEMQKNKKTKKVLEKTFPEVYGKEESKK